MVIENAHVVCLKEGRLYFDSNLIDYSTLYELTKK